MRALVKTTFARFFRRSDGAALVEFAILLPVFVLSFFVIVEFSRTFFSYQAAISGVRDAARFAARVAQYDVCDTNTAATGSVTIAGVSGHPSGSSDAISQIIWNTIDNESDVLPTNVQLTSVNSIYTCETASSGTFRQTRVPMAVISATFEITFPLIGLLELNGGFIEGGKITHTVTDRSRIFGV